MKFVRSSFLACMLIAALLPGCVSSEGKAEETPADPNAPVMEVDPQSEFGLVKGTIVTDEAEPIEGAQVGLAKTEFGTTTNAEGLFGIPNVPPGTYTLIVGALGYEAGARNVEVAAGQATQVTISLTSLADPSAVYHEVVPFTGFFECAMGIYAWVSSCSYPYTAVYLTAHEHGVNGSQYGVPPDIQKNQHRFNLTIHQGVGELFAELQWQPASAAANKMQMIVMCGDYQPVWDDCLYPNDLSGDSIRYNSSSGKSPVVVRVDNETFLKKGKGMGKHDLAKNEHIWVMNYVALPFGCVQANADCLTTSYTYWQLAFQQRFYVWDTVFYNSVAPDGYTALSDA
jgi:hypothetical protein